jgi:hypothetical protein
MTVAEKPQNMVALARANKTRLARAALKRDIRCGEVSISDVLLADIPDWLTMMPVGELLRSVRAVGPSRCRQILARVGDGRWPCSELKEVGYLTMRQRAYLADVLGVGEKAA